MKRSDFLRLISGKEKVEYAPVAGMLRSGYGFAGYFNSRLNEDLEATCVLVNTRLVDLRGGDEPAGGPRIAGFSDFLEEIVRQSYHTGEAGEEEAPEQPPLETTSDIFGKSIPLAAIPFDEIAVVYPVAQIGRMMADLQRERKRIPTFFDLDNKSIILKLLRTRLW